tara:strand:+ start:457 stop:1347 length:891 start_codon:yes stop_codon:yes gene_type:complete
MPNFITYNILNNHFDNEANFIISDENIGCLESNFRFDKIKEKLLPFIKKKSVIALQEVSNLWGGKLFIWFQENSYMFKVYNYGNKWSDHMGIALAIPMEYKIIEFSQKVISENINIKEAEESYFDKLWYSVREYFKYRDQRDLISIRNAKKRHNAIMAVKLLINDKEYWFSTYHFPCAFYDKLLMELHAKACIEWLNKLDGLVIFGTDMNSLPKSSVYNLFKESFKSVYYDYYNKEPVSTNKINNKSFGKFSGTIDYIWISKQIKIKSVKKIPNVIKEMPNINEPSDHLSISCEIE